MLKEKIRRLYSSMAFNIIGGVIILLLVNYAIISAVSLSIFSEVFNTEYSTTSYHMADTATTLINGDHLDEYLNGEEFDEYIQTKSYLDTYCSRIGVSLIYVIMVDRSDYGRFVSVFNAEDNSVDNSNYTAWELGHRRDTTNDEYRRKYREVYEQAVPYETVYRMNTTDGQKPHITTLAPIKDSAGDVAAILCLQWPISELTSARRAFMVRISLITLMAAAVLIFAIHVYLKREFVQPVKKVSREAVRFATENTRGKPLGRISRLDEISNLAQSIDRMEEEMEKYIKNLTAATVERERISSELHFARSIQRNAIPNVFPAFPDRTEFDIYASMTPAKEVGGDFYNFFLVDDDHLALIIGDVSGKGVPAALYMMIVNIFISQGARMGEKPGVTLSFINNTMLENNREDMFVTVWLGILEISTGRITAANAGHEDAAICHKDGGFELFRTKHDLVAGAMMDIEYNDFEIQLQKGDKLFIYTDGVPEATDIENNMFTLDRMIDALNEKKEDTPQAVLENVRHRVDEFAGEAPQFDDLTMLCLAYYGD